MKTKKEKSIAMPISHKIDFKAKTVKRHKEGHYVMMKGSIHQRGITIVSIYLPNIT
jgi:hypothetical protein